MRLQELELALGWEELENGVMYTVLGGAMRAGGSNLISSQLVHRLVDPILKTKVSRSPAPR